MPAVPLGLLRGCLALLGLFFPHMLGRALVRRLRHDANAGLVGWTIRTVLVLAAVWWRSGFDTVTILAWLLAAFGFAAGFFLEKRPRKREDLTDVIFPGEG
jgi:hypothetical protein